MDDQYTEFLTYDNFYLAFKRLQTVDGFTLYKNLYRPDIEFFGFFLEESIDLLVHQIRENIYEPKNGVKIYIPKKNNLVRPLTLLNFNDLLVYQALINVIADVVFDDLSLLRSKNILFGNSYRKSNEEGSIFFMDKWKDQWKSYNKVTESHFNEGYEYFTDFDIASFFDTISHDILISLLRRCGVNSQICELLKQCLSVWSIDRYRKNYCSGHGIPQGPIASSILADVYLTPVDEQVTSSKKLNVRYLRYVDDIRILTQNELEGKKAIAYLDLLTRDYGLIPQASKIATRKVENIKKELSFQHVKFSTIAGEYRSQGRKLKLATHNKQKKQFLNCFVIDKDNEEFLNKTIIRFSLYKLNKDDDIRKALLDNLEYLYPHIDSVLYYLSKHYSNDELVLSALNKLLLSDSLLFQHIIAVIFRDFKHLPFNQELFERHFSENRSFWLIKYFLLDWLDENDESELLKSIRVTDFHLVNRKLLRLQVKYAKSLSAKKMRLKDSLSDKDDMLALQAAYHYFMNTFTYPSPDDNTNSFVKDVLQKTRPNYIKNTLLAKYGITDENDFFNSSGWPNQSEFKEMKYNFRLFNQSIEFDPSKSLMSLNNFNEIVFNKIAERVGIPVGDNYGGSISAIAEKFPYASFYFEKINTSRNERTDAHYKDRDGNIRVRITFSELQQLLLTSKFEFAMKEILTYSFS